MGGDKNILIIDDDPNICRFLGESLRLQGYGVTTFGEADKGKEELLTGRYDLALIDVLLPGTSGLEICQSLRTHAATSTLPVIMMTAFYRDAEHIRQARETFGATDYLLKPFPLATLQHRVESLIGAPGAPAKSGQLTVEGNLADTPLPHLIHNLYTLRVTGLLHLERENVKKVVYIKEGYPIFVRSNLVSECLGKMLVKGGQITEAQCEESLRLVKETGRLQGTVLIEMGLLSPRQLHDSLASQVTEKLLEAFAWTRGSHRFIQARDFKQGITSVELSPAALILEGIRRYFSADRLQEILKPYLGSYLVQTENPHYRFQDMRLTEQDQEFLDHCVGNATLETLLQRHPLLRRENEELAAALIVAEMVEQLDQPSDQGLSHDGPSNSPENLQVRQKLLNAYSRMIKLDHFALLGVAETSTQEEIRKAYFALVKTYHPDRYFEKGLSDDLRQKLTTLFQRIGEAYNVLSDPDQANAYRARQRGEEKLDVAAVLEAETAFQKGRILLKMNKYAEACQLFAKAVEGSPEEAEYLSYHGWAIYKSAGGQEAKVFEARATLLRSLELNPQIDSTHLFLGYIFKDAGQGREAQRRFELAIQCNPDCAEALRELRLLNLREAPKERPKGIFGKVFG